MPTTIQSQFVRPPRHSDRRDILIAEATFRQSLALSDMRGLDELGHVPTGDSSKPCSLDWYNNAIPSDQTQMITTHRLQRWTFADFRAADAPKNPRSNSIHGSSSDV